MNVYIVLKGITSLACVVTIQAMVQETKKVWPASLRPTGIQHVQYLSVNCFFAKTAYINVDIEGEGGTMYRHANPKFKICL